LANRGYVLARGRTHTSTAASLRDRLGEFERSYLTGLDPGQPR